MAQAKPDGLKKAITERRMIIRPIYFERKALTCEIRYSTLFFSIPVPPAYRLWGSCQLKLSMSRVLPI